MAGELLIASITWQLHVEKEKELDLLNGKLCGMEWELKLIDYSYLV